MSKVRSFSPAGPTSDSADELRRQLDEAVEARTRAEQANAAKDKLLFKLAHDLRTPLSSMMLNAQRLREGELAQADLTRISESLQRAVQQQTRLIDRLVDATLFEPGQPQPSAASEQSDADDREQVRPLDRPGNVKPYTELKDLRILYIDDDFRTREAVLEVLELTGARVALAASPADGMLALDVFKPHVILCDLDMPGEDGFDFVRKLRAREAGQVPPIPVLAFTALASEQHKRAALAAGFQLHLAKPIDIDRLRDAVLHLVALIGTTPKPVATEPS
jgi:CheY-like chemotaxis protein